MAKLEKIVNVDITVTEPPKKEKNIIIHLFEGIGTVVKFAYQSMLVKVVVWGCFVIVAKSPLPLGRLVYACRQIVCLAR